MKHRALLIVAGLVGAGTLAVSLSVAAAGTSRPESHAAPTKSAAIAPPAVPNAAAIRAKYKGQSIQFVGDAAVGQSHKRDLKLVARFQKDTGIKINLVPHPSGSDAAYSQLARAFGSKSSKPDVAMIDVVWPGAFAPYLVDLKPALGKASKQFIQSIVQNDTIGGKLVALPWFGDFGILYYRTDLLKKYGYSKPPTTWNTLFSMAKKIQDGEQKSNKNFYGLVYQGNSYEGLTCDALEWVASVGGGNFIDNGKVTINNSKAATILDAMRNQVGKLTPRGVTSYDEEGARNVFAAGNAMFMRNWPYAYSANQTTPVKGKFAVTVLPHGAAGHSVGTVGGWQLGVSKFSKHKPAAIEFVRYMTSPAVQKFNAIYNSNVPTIPAVAKIKAVIKTNPYLTPAIANVARVTRPGKYLKTHYNEGSKAIYQGVSQILNGTPAKNVLPSIASKLNSLIK
ncbi:MAG TPA: ABC transporter substrate-binding protein [Gaiellaceae bacterium]